MKKQASNLNLFEQNESPKSETCSPASRSSSPTPPASIDPLACPKCGGASQQSVRPAEMGGTRYCPRCAGEDGCYYFTPAQASAVTACDPVAPKPILLKAAPIKPYFQENGITIYHGDAREVMLWIPSASIDLCITDPPYGVSYEGGVNQEHKAAEIRLAGDKSANLYGPVLKLLTSRCKPHAALYLFYASIETMSVFTAVENAGFEVRNILIWNKHHFAGTLYAQYKQKYEPFLYCHIHGESPQWFGPGNETTVWNGDKAADNKEHPTQKPIDLMMRAIRNSSKKGDLVFDPFCGSGTTLRAAKDLGRCAIGIEIEEKYCEVAAKRMSQNVLEL